MDHSNNALDINPDIYQMFSKKVKEKKFPSVPEVDCSNCREVKFGRAEDHVKCCDIIPYIPNFSAGAILASAQAPTVQALLDERRADPFAIHIPPILAAEYTAAREGRRYGKACSFLIDGRCSIYKQRPGTCLSYHCYYPSSLFVEFYACLRSLIDQIQHSLSVYLVYLMEIDMEKYEVFWTERDEEPSYRLWSQMSQSSDAYQVFWQDWLGREADFFQHCWQLLQGFQTQDFKAFRQFQQSMVPIEERDDLFACEPREPPEAVRKIFERSKKIIGWNISIATFEEYLLWYLQRINHKSYRNSLSVVKMV